MKVFNFIHCSTVQLVLQSEQLVLENTKTVL